MKRTFNGFLLEKVVKCVPFINDSRQRHHCDKSEPDSGTGERVRVLGHLDAGIAGAEGEGTGKGDEEPDQRANETLEASTVQERPVLKLDFLHII